MNVGIIPARGASEGLPGKNTRLMLGRPLIAYVIEAALRSRRLAGVYVSTEDAEIDEIARREGAQVIRHPAHLSGPTSPTAPVIAWDVDNLESAGPKIAVVVTLRATTPFCTTAHIDALLALLASVPAADSVVSVTPSSVHPMRLKRVLPDGRLQDAFEPEGRRPRRRQELERLYIRNGGIYAAKRNVISPDSLWGDYCLAYVMPEERSININTEIDFAVAELLLSRRTSSGHF